MSDVRYSLNAPAHFTQEIKKSRFSAHAASVNSIDEALAYLDAANDADASHHCWAYRIGQHYRFNDDGEPAGTAGKPILQAIDGQRFDHVVLVVSRWFGGIKLGAGGLVRAYGGCAAECLRRALRTELVATIDLRFFIEFADYAILRTRIDGWSARVLDATFDAQGVRLALRIAQTRRDDVCSLLADLTRGQAKVETID